MVSDVVPSRQVRLRDFRYPGEVLSLLLTFFVLTSLYALAVIFFPASAKQVWQALIITALGLAVYIITVVVQQRAAFGTLVRVSPRQFPELYEITLVAARRLNSPPVPLYVKRQSEQNIYTLGLWGQPLIVVTSAMVDQMTLDSLQFFIGREVGHIRAGHTWLRTLIRPLGTGVPIIGKLLDSVVFGDWMNRTELTADRAGFIACNSLTVAVSTMLKFGVGVKLFEKLDIREFLQQLDDLRSVGGRFTEIVAEQPYLIQRVRRLVRYALSKEFREITPGDDPRYTQILDALPQAFINTSLYQLRAEALAAEAHDSTLTTRAELTGPVEPAPGGEDDNAPDPRLTLVSADGGERYTLRRRHTRIGRNLDNDIVIANDRVSRYHAEIVREGGELMITDAGSRNGVWLNGSKVTAPTPLRSGDNVRLGRQEFTFNVNE
jgi:pSer/pThr/pTyr-binding forkhead associated (FHA) protein/Zn-dependent protease with chaperone function